MKKTKIMLEIEKKTGEPIDIVLTREYIENGKSTRQLADFVGVSQGTIQKLLKECGIERRSLSEARFAHLGKEIQKPSDEQLRRWYIDEKKSTVEIGEIVGVD